MNALATLKSWELLCQNGAMNLLDVEGKSYCWSANPRAQKNGALVGEVHVQERGKNYAYLGAYKIAPDGQVLEMPVPLRQVLVKPEPPKCVTKECPLADGECSASCYLRECNPESLPYEPDPMTLAKEADL